MNDITVRLCRQLAENARTTVNFTATFECQTQSEARHIAATLAVDFGTVARDELVGTSEKRFRVELGDFTALVAYKDDDDE